MALAGFSGCSTDVEVERETTSSIAEPESLTTDKRRTAVSVDLFTATEDGRTVEMPLDGVLNVHGCVHLSQHLHINLVEGDRDAERISLEIVREWTKGECGRDRRD